MAWGGVVDRARGGVSVGIDGLGGCGGWSGGHRQPGGARWMERGALFTLHEEIVLQG